MARRDGLRPVHFFQQTYGTEAVPPIIRTTGGLFLGEPRSFSGEGVEVGIAFQDVDALEKRNS
jgi:hypothetical protein